MEIYIVRKGDTLYSIASHYGMPVERLIYDNELTPDGFLVQGQSLLILVPKVIHRIQLGQTIASIAELYNVSARQIYQNNPYLLNEDYLIEGDFLAISYGDNPTLNLESVGYAYPYIRREVLREALLYLDEIRIFSYGFTESGNLIPPVNEEPILNEANLFGVRPVLVLTPLSAEGTFNNELVRALVEDENAQRQLANELLGILRSKQYEGVDVDFEYILAENREGYAAFVSYLNEQLSAEGFRLSVSLAPKTSEDQPGVLYEGIDYHLLGQAASSVFLMTYEWGYTYGPPMAVAPIDKVREVLDYAVTEIPRYKIYMGVPNYGYDWTLPYRRGESRARVIGNVEAVDLAVRNRADILYDETAQSPHFTYISDGVQHEVWFEDVRSMKKKYETSAEYQFYGIGYWNLMRPFRANWLLLHHLVNQT